MEPLDETLVAIVATTVSFLLVIPFLIKWWPRVQAKTQETRKQPGSAPRSARPATVAPSVAARAPGATERRQGSAGAVMPRRSPAETRVMRPGQISGGRTRTPRPAKNG